MSRPRKQKVPLSPLESIAQKIGDDWADVLSTLEAADSAELKNRVTQASQAIHDAQEELNENGAYLKAKEDCKVLSQGLKEVRKRQNGIIKVCLQLRKDRGEA
jgi:hypothetical protein